MIATSSSYENYCSTTVATMLCEIYPTDICDTDEEWFEIQKSYDLAVRLILARIFNVFFTILFLKMPFSKSGFWGKVAKQRMA
jgi:hypothetical protein